MKVPRTVTKNILYLNSTFCSEVLIFARVLYKFSCLLATIYTRFDVDKLEWGVAKWAEEYVSEDSGGVAKLAEAYVSEEAYVGEEA